MAGRGEARRLLRELERLQPAPPGGQLDWAALLGALQQEDGSPPPPVACGEGPEPNPFWAEVLKQLREERPTVEEMLEAALQDTPQRLPCGFRELRPDERLASGGGEQRRAD